jgi:hypothetical protein
VTYNGGHNLMHFTGTTKAPNGMRAKSIGVHIAKRQWDWCLRGRKVSKIVRGAASMQQGRLSLALRASRTCSGTRASMRW